MHSACMRPRYSKRLFPVTSIIDAMHGTTTGLLYCKSISLALLLAAAFYTNQSCIAACMHASVCVRARDFGLAPSSICRQQATINPPQLSFSSQGSRASRADLRTHVFFFHHVLFVPSCSHTVYIEGVLHVVTRETIGSCSHTVYIEGVLHVVTRETIGI
jgi:hypothetical protein